MVCWVCSENVVVGCLLGRLSRLNLCLNVVMICRLLL